ncbi:hypothetical protein IGI96_001364 [Enterococcus sp. DIV0421]|uniref:DUF1697 domain-containing protein n=1 Tax=unclassified Enterococcus TaxID=2608891 RepID=UPI000A34E12C|nr:DUF1697 domain-containing protein [Enterococcus sp. 5B3_DIV0040]OTO01712.1 hypothetical protein A5883_002528 [Enterococcus sp. 5B3_DIV0040]
MQRYIALLRGINVGGNNKISMKELKAGFEELGFSNVVTYLNSGNVIFSSEDDDPQALAEMIKAMIKRYFSFDIAIYIIRQRDLQERLTHIPDWSGTEDKTIYDNLIFLMPSLTYEVLSEKLGAPNADLEQVFPYKDVVFWSYIRKDYQKTNWWKKTASTSVGKQITIRTINTVRKIAEM